MTNCDEIEFLIVAVAQTGGVLSSELYLIVGWAILLCIILGPVGVRVIVGRIENIAAIAGGRNEILGAWEEAGVPQTGARIGAIKTKGG